MRLDKDGTRDRIVGVFTKLGLRPPVFLPVGAQGEYLSGGFQHQNRMYTIEIYDEDVLMHEGTSIYECYSREDYRGSEALVNSFTDHLSRYLSGQPWYKNALLDHVRSVLKRLRRPTSS